MAQRGSVTERAVDFAPRVLDVTLEPFNLA
jgi:hypothetical protein